MSNQAVTYTTAPAELDWLFTKELDPNVGTLDDAIVRATRTGSLWPYQRERYQLAGYMAMAEEEWYQLVVQGRGRLRPWREDPAFLAWLKQSGLELGREVGVAYAAFQGGRLLSAQL